MKAIKVHLTYKKHKYNKLQYKIIEPNISFSLATKLIIYTTENTCNRIHVFIIILK